MSYQFPDSAKTVVMTAAAILDWLEVEASDVRAQKKPGHDPLVAGLLEGVALHLEDMAHRFAITTMRGLDGDPNSARPAPKGKP
jgi:hypothetical protein